MERLPHVLSEAESSNLSTGLRCRMALLQEWEGRAGRCFFPNLLNPECSLAWQGTAELASGSSCRVLLPPLLSSGFLAFLPSSH